MRLVVTNIEEHISIFNMTENNEKTYNQAPVQWEGPNTVEKLSE